jgi:hypothetical protein
MNHPPLGEGDYYWENGLMVLTEAYLRRRGQCCGSGCRHCPYPPAQAGETSIRSTGIPACGAEHTGRNACATF